MNLLMMKVVMMNLKMMRMMMKEERQVVKKKLMTMGMTQMSCYHRQVNQSTNEHVRGRKQKMHHLPIHCKNQRKTWSWKTRQRLFSMLCGNVK